MHNRIPDRDRHHCLKSSNVQKSDDGQILDQILPESYDLHEIPRTQKEALVEQKYFTGSMPLLFPTTVLRHVVVPRHSPLPQYLRDMVKKLAGEGRNKTWQNTNHCSTKHQCKYRKRSHNNKHSTDI